MWSSIALLPLLVVILPVYLWMLPNNGTDPKHKLIVYPESPLFDYNLADDPLELHDISNIPSNKNLVFAR